MNSDPRSDIQKNYFNRQETVLDQEKDQKRDLEGGMIQEKGAHQEAGINTEAPRMPGGAGQGRTDSLKWVLVRIVWSAVISVGSRSKQHNRRRYDRHRSRSRSDSSSHHRHRRTKQASKNTGSAKVSNPKNFKEQLKAMFLQTQNQTAEEIEREIHLDDKNLCELLLKFW